MQPVGSGSRNGAASSGHDNAWIDEDDLRLIVGLLANAAGPHLSIREKRSRLMGRLTAFVGGSTWNWVLLELTTQSGFLADRPARPQSRGTAHSGIDRLCPPPADGPIPGKVPRSGKICAQHQIDESLVSELSIALTDQVPSMSRFLLAQAVLEEVSWLHFRDDQWTPPDSETLSLRKRQVLALLLRGMGRKEIAAELGISLGAVGSYSQEIFQVCGVNSQIALMQTLQR